MRRREFFSFAAVGAAVAPQISVAKQHNDLGSLLRDLEDAIKGEMPGVSRIEIRCRPEDPKMPLMIFAYRD
ncbi:hypothetical protein [Sinorhizobium meliloti]|uniref:hypothetical protein n=1 Tax=Rhizobium meliloti TaxID=382 RepID=UPI000FDB673F|nr:hypothetical protein [Sinorhizobium meliloti]RVG88704.1 hypothetical protein CN219_03805 [Sinorhizobium meliloti]RVI39014.1 hypothetical protein CN197_02430 [Sinorhizobium meliloti]RVI46650.1 hypothetical protein CN196_09280 [Sinorhizobium meliloti]RVJ25651.1 hypothetical protein CN177_13320 [Sinorhizobium meliloti]RVK02270.1 hypothetical protein CN170_08810 [Sinorhizobium meliloti]